MKKAFNYRLWVFIFVAVLGVILSLPSIFGIQGRKVALGLDLQGGLNLLLEVKTQEAIKARLSSLASSIAYESNEKKILIDSVRIVDDHIIFEMFDRKEKLQIDQILAKFDGISVIEDNNTFSIAFTQEEIPKIEEDALNQAISTIRKRLDIFGLQEPSVTKRGKNNILVEVPGKNTPDEEERLRKLISKPSHLQFMAVDEDRNARVNLMNESEAQSYGDVILPFAQDFNEGEGALLLVKKVPILDGSSISSASPARDNNGKYVVNFMLNSDGAQQFGNFTAKNIGKRLAIVLDDKVYSAPVVRARISDSGQISGNFDKNSAADLSITLKSGALPASMEVIEKRGVGPSLGSDSIRASLIALVSGFVMVVIFMVLYYNIAGIIAVSALLVNIVLIVAVMSLFGATLTLPGMAGIVLTVGMAVDANIIINERIREALRLGNNVIKSIEIGYTNASRAIFDSNITTFLIAILLYANATGAIQGFAITLSLGIIASILTAIIGTHGIYVALLPKLAKTNNTFLWFGIKNGSIDPKQPQNNHTKK
ncbi:protein translocase subunit SecD [Helicobacter equorum]|uniref:protein translocase subunit SecD n=1 Tax=Helicobacter equorum TaxID=361872 RepID=UPI000CF061DE|nr:protein translocase subunit SecD [Helicobacter equorum]